MCSSVVPFEQQQQQQQQPKTIRKEWNRRKKVKRFRFSSLFDLAWPIRILVIHIENTYQEDNCHAPEGFFISGRPSVQYHPSNWIFSITNLPVTADAERKNRAHQSVRKNQRTGNA